jgi:murein DD-endopeptidase MepM/ murein hydrolase activator NlpD
MRRAPAYAPKASVSARSTAPNAIGGWTTEGGTPVVVAQGESAATVAQRFGVPTDTLLSLNGYSSRSQVQPGARLIIPAYRASGARTAAVAAPAVAPAAAPQGQRFGAKSLVGEEIEQAKQAAPAKVALTAPRLAAPTLNAPKLNAPKVDAAAQLAEQRARLAQAEATTKAEKEKILKLKAETAKAEALKAETARLAAKQTADAAKKTADAKALKMGATAQVAQAQGFVKGAPPAATAQMAQIGQSTQAKAAGVAAPVAAKFEAPKAEAAKVAKADANVDAESTASLQPATTAAAAGDSANPEFRWPARGRVIQGFGNGGNDGINIAVPEGTQVKAAESGVVAYAGSELKGYGNLVLIRHPNGFVTAYANNGSINVKRGDQVKRGQTIALSGQSGNVASPQLHFELRKGSKPVDPSTYLAGL